MLMRVVAAVAVLAGLLAGGAARAGEDLAIEAFSGQFVGTGIAENEQSESLALTLRDLDVRITPDDGGFALSWTTVLRAADGSGVKRKAGAIYFVPTDQAGVFRAAIDMDPLAGLPFVWARIQGETLTVHSLLVNNEGSYEIQTYDRTLTGDGMDLKFTRVRDGQPMRTVTGKLARVGG